MLLSLLLQTYTEYSCIAMIPYFICFSILNKQSRIRFGISPYRTALLKYSSLVNEM